MGKVLKRANRNRAATAALLVSALLLSAGAAAWALSSSSWSRTRKSLEETIGQTTAEKAKAEESGRRTAELMEKRALSARVLRAARADLMPALRDLKKHFYTDMPAETRAELLNRALSKIDRIADAIGADKTSMSVYLALRGIAFFLGGKPEDGLMNLRESRKFDPDIALSWLLEGAWNLVCYMNNREAPLLVTSSDGVSLVAPPVETETQLARLGDFRDLLEAATKCPVLGELAAQDLGRLVDGLAALGQGKVDQTEAGLTAALSVEELWCIEEELRFTRASMRLCSGRFNDALDDLNHLTEWAPQSARFLEKRTAALLGKAQAAAAAGLDPSADIERLMEEVSRTLEMIPGLGFPRLHRSSSNLILGHETAAKGEDPRRLFRLALMDAEKAAALMPGQSTPKSVCAAAGATLGSAMAAAGEDPSAVFEKAVEDAKEALSANPADIPALSWLGFIRIEQALWDASWGKDRPEILRAALKDFEPEIGLNPESLFAAIQRSRALIALSGAQTAQPEQAEQRLLEAAEAGLAPGEASPACAPAMINAAQAFAMIAEVRSDSGKDWEAPLARAKEIFGKALLLKPGHAAALVNLGNTLVIEGRLLKAAGRNPFPAFEEAVRILEEAAKKSRYGGKAALALSLACTALGYARTDLGGQSLECFKNGAEAARTALEARPGALAALKALGSALIGLAYAEEEEKRDPGPFLDEAAGVLTRALDIAPENPQILVDRGLAHLRLSRKTGLPPDEALKRLDKSLADLEKARRMGSTGFRVFQNLAKAHSDKGKILSGSSADPREHLRKSLAFLEEVVKLKPLDKTLLNDRSAVWIALGEAEARFGGSPEECYAAGIRDACEVVAAFPERVDLRNNLGNAWQCLGGIRARSGKDPSECFEKAIVEYSKVLEKSPQVWQVHANVGMLNLSLEKYGEAHECFLKAVKFSRDRVPALRELRDKAARLMSGPDWAREVEGGAAMIDRGRADLAVAAIEKALETASMDEYASGAQGRIAVSEAWFHLARAHSLASTGRKAAFAKPGPVDAAESKKLREKAFECLAKALEAGFADKVRLSRDSTLDPIRSEPGFGDMLEKHGLK